MCSTGLPAPCTSAWAQTPVHASVCMCAHVCVWGEDGRAVGEREVGRHGMLSAVISVTASWSSWGAESERGTQRPSVTTVCTLHTKGFSALEPLARGHRLEDGRAHVTSQVSDRRSVHPQQGLIAKTSSPRNCWPAWGWHTTPSSCQDVRRGWSVPPRGLAAPVKLSWGGGETRPRSRVAAHLPKMQR